MKTAGSERWDAGAEGVGQYGRVKPHVAPSVDGFIDFAICR